MDKWEIRSLINKLNKYTKAYDEGNPLISDSEWDSLYFKLVEAEKETGLIFPDSPTQRIIYRVVNNLNKVQHNHPMLSLDKTKNPDDIVSFVAGHEWLGMFKMDGLTISLTYENGKLVRAETRGNGIEGENVTHNAFVIKSIPKTIPTKDVGCHIYNIANRVIIDGEIICTFKDFEPFKEEYKNPRNFASGSIRLLDSKECASRNLTFVAWDLIEGIDEDFFFWRLEKLDDWGFITVPRVGDAETVEDAIDILDRKSEHEIYPIDGYVFKFESKKYGESLGRTDHHFKNGIALKFHDEEYETTLKDIIYDVSRNGILTPVAVFEPIEIDGSVIEKASLYNISSVKETLGETPYKGQKINIIKSNMIIPKVTKAEKRTIEENNDRLIRIDNVICPICGKPAIIKTSDSNVEVLYCDNDSCSGKLIQQIDYFCGKRGLDIRGLSRKTLEKLVEWGYVTCLKDIFKLRKYQARWTDKPGFGKISVNKILDAIDDSLKETPLANFISAIGINGIGLSTAKEICKYYSTWDDFRAAVGGDWTEFNGFGIETSKAINNFDYTEVDKIAEFFTFKQPEELTKDLKIESAAIKDKTFVITGKVYHFKNRDELKANIEAHGGKVTGSVSSKTNYLISNEASTSAKSIKAKELGVSVITEEEYLKMI